LKKKAKKFKVQEPFQELTKELYPANYELIHGDTFENLRRIGDGKYDLVITSPPYNIGKEYETKQSIEKYLDQQEIVIDEICRLISDTGSICWQTGNYVDKGEVYPLDIFYYQIFKKHKLKLRNRIIWHFGHGLHSSKRFSGRYETILWLTKSDNYIFNLDNVRIPSKYPGKRHFKGPLKGQPSGNPKGKNPSDIWEIVAQDWENQLWNIPNVKSNHPEKTEHPCQFPVELVERCILGLTNEGGWVLDPYSGVGSTLIAAIKNNRNCTGIEKEKRYVEITTERIDALIEGKLKIRPINKPIHIPKPNDKVANVPDEWKQLIYSETKESFL
jgi:DNA modification methylase